MVGYATVEAGTVLELHGASLAVGALQKAILEPSCAVQPASVATVVETKLIMIS